LTGKTAHSVNIVALSWRMAGGKTAIQTVTPLIASVAPIIIKPDCNMEAMRWAGK
jgi:hypothetical protein